METKKTPSIDVKSRFFAQYWGQKVMKKNIEGLDNFYSEPDGFIRSMTIDSPLFLELKPLSKITKEDLQQIFIKEFPFDTIFNSYDFMCKYELRNYFIISNVCEKAYLQIIDFENNKEFNSFKYKTISHIGIDYLRKKGYAVPFDEYSVEDLVSFGWLKLT
jgi:hypothetical protein